jgi:hypothetical protein
MDWHGRYCDQCDPPNRITRKAPNSPSNPDCILTSTIPETSLINSSVDFSSFGFSESELECTETMCCLDLWKKPRFIERGSERETINPSIATRQRQNKTAYVRVCVCVCVCVCVVCVCSPNMCACVCVCGRRCPQGALPLSIECSFNFHISHSLCVCVRVSRRLCETSCQKPSMAMRECVHVHRERERERERERKIREMCTSICVCVWVWVFGMSSSVCVCVCVCVCVLRTNKQTNKQTGRSK